MTEYDAFNDMLSKPAKPWREAFNWYASRVNSLRAFRDIVRHCPLEHDCTTHDMAKAARALILVQIGRTIWAPGDWQGHMAEALGVNRRTIERWAGGQFAPPSGVWDELREIAKRRVTEIQALLG